MDANVVIALGFIIFLAIAVWGMAKIRKGWQEEQGTLAASALLNATEGYYLCGIPLKEWVKKSIPMKLLWYGIADFARPFGLELTYALSKSGASVVMYYRWNATYADKGHYDVIIRFTWEGETWQYIVLNSYGWNGSLDHVSQRNREYKEAILGFMNTSYIAPWMKDWREQWEPCHTVEGSMAIAPDSLLIDKSLTPHFNWEEHAEEIRKRISSIVMIDSDSPKADASNDAEVENKTEEETE